MIQTANNECWDWNGTIATNGYGRVFANNKWIGAHRVVWEFVYGKIPDGLYVLHRCDNRRCCNPNHLFLGTHLDNVRDATLKGRLGGARQWGRDHWNGRKTHCKRGHPFSNLNTYLKPGGGRECKECAKEYKRAWHQSSKENNK
jgi:HNH endonuclease